MTDILEQMKGALIRFDGLFLSRDGAADAMPFLGADALYLFPEAIKEIEELRASIKGKTFTVLSDDGEAWKARAEAAEAKANVMVADKINLRSELLSVEAKLAKAVDGLNSIASNTCCDQCQEAALVALATLAEIGDKL